MTDEQWEWVKKYDDGTKYQVSKLGKVQVKTGAIDQPKDGMGPAQTRFKEVSQTNGVVLLSGCVQDGPERVADLVRAAFPTEDSGGE